MEISLIIILSLLLVSGIIAFTLRRVVPTNQVHIVQSRNSTVSYGKDTDNGNTYYEWPSWIPVIGITKVVLPVSVFDLKLEDYEAYDIGRVPFVVDIVAFFRVKDPNLAAQRIYNFTELRTQLAAILQGSVRTILASHDIDTIMLQRSKFGTQFTQEVEEQLESWGVTSVKNIELMDIRDSAGNHVVKNIMDKKKSLIEMESRVAVATNNKKAQTAEIENQREVEMQKQMALQKIGETTALKEKAIGLANEKAKQEIKEQERVTKQKEMAVIKVADIERAEITKNMNIIKAEETKQSQVITAQGRFEAEKLEANAIKVKGEAQADAEKLMQLAPINAQIELAKEIGSNESYQKYLITIKQVEANQAIGIEQAKALEKADIKVITNGSSPTEGINKVMDLFSAKGGTEIAGMLEGLAQSDIGKNLIGKIGGKGRENKSN